MRWSRRYGPQGGYIHGTRRWWCGLTHWTQVSSEAWAYCVIAPSARCGWPMPPMTRCLRTSAAAAQRPPRQCRLQRQNSTITLSGSNATRTLCRLSGAGSHGTDSPGSRCGSSRKNCLYYSAMDGQ
jgi:hypothetical protein